MIKTTQIKVGGMTCASCSRAVELALRRVEGVSVAGVNLATDMAVVQYDDSLANVKALHKAVVDVGFKVIDDEQDASRQWEAARNKMFFAWAFTLPSMLWMFASMTTGVHYPNELMMRIGMLLLVLPVLVVSGRQTFASAYRSVLHGSANMDVLIVLGTGSAFLTGVIQFWLPIGNFTGISAMIMAFHLTGRYIEKKARGKASEEIRKLLELGAKTALIERDGSVNEVPLSDVMEGDIMIVKPGMKIPTDGKIIEGITSIDESMVTGESIPVTREAGDPVIGATINGNGFIRVQATRVGKDTFLSQIIRMVDEAQSSKVPIQLLADRLTGFFVPVVILLAILTFGTHIVFPAFYSRLFAWAATYLPWVDPSMNTVTQAIYAMVAVFVIACPCALGLATPTALMVGSGLGAKNGILIRNAEAIQTLKDVSVIVFDKTGTVTQGKPLVNAMRTLEMDERQFLAISRALESASEHPLAGAITQYAESHTNLKAPEISSFRNIPGKGISAVIGHETFYAGSESFMLDNGIHLHDIRRDIDLLQNQANTIIFISDMQNLLGYFSVSDQIKPDSRSAISALKARGFRTLLLTGDNERSGKAIADAAGIDQVVAEVKPGDKVNVIKNLQSKHGKVAMVGDGINDAPALKQADVGIAVGSGADIAIESADITLVRNDMMSVEAAINLSLKTFAKIKQNLFWAFFYNLLAIPLAISGLLHPVIAEIAMAGSSITVVGNANLLRKSKIRSTQRN